MAKKVKVVMMKGRSARRHMAVECTPTGDFSYLLCKGFPSVGKHESIPLELQGDFIECKQCARVWAKMQRQKPDDFVLQ